MTNDDCPSTDNGNHRYFIFKTFEHYETVPKSEVTDLQPGRQLYERREYAIIGCNCGSVMRTVAEQR